MELIETNGKSINIPDEFICPISHEIMSDPVFTADGHSYDRTNISKWFAMGKHTSPKTNLVLSHQNLTPNHALKALIQSFVEGIYREKNISSEEINEKLKLAPRRTLTQASPCILKGTSNTLLYYSTCKSSPREEENLKWAASEGDLAKINQLLKDRVNINGRGMEGSICSFFSGLGHKTPLLAAAYYNKTEAVKLLIERGADINATDSQKYTALDYAVYYEYKDLAEYLRDQGVRQNVTDSGNLKAVLNHA